jgi:hypothetical protein
VANEAIPQRMKTLLQPYATGFANLACFGVS